MTRLIHALAVIAVIAVPVVGWFVVGWTGATTLVVYWFETVAVCLLIAARVRLHQRWAPRRGHFRYQAPSSARRSSQSASFVSGFLLISMVFCGAHALFLTAILFLLQRNGRGDLADIDWARVRLACLIVLVFLIVDFGVDLIRLRQWSFWRIEQLASHGTGRLVVVHLTLILGLFGIAMTDAPDALFGVFVVLRTLAALSAVLPQWEPAAAPEWLSRIMNRVPNVHPGKRFEEFWTEDRAQEIARRERNDKPWVNN